MLRIDPNDVDAYSNRGGEYLFKKDYDQALRDYNEVIRRRPQDGVAYSNRARTWFLLRDYDKAIADYDRAIQLPPYFPHEYWWRGEAWLMKAEYAKAISDFNESTDLARMWQEEQPFFLRAVTQMLLRQPECVSGFQETIDLCEWKGERAPDAAILGSIAARLNGDLARSDKFLRDAAQNVKEAWALYAAISEG